ncbi:long-chain-fatty-acid--CoA ligase [Bacteriovorax sp. Seq25_V]|uniref:long-chain-fatty-acid--CoA ligase n=1 Tax=Bacteriovorax sp. Seq25_V TaxID=1201288 RepID=UPI00038A351B|nr:long-chain-fatty-acid--CoA ligase [Bacteriovorax sp. Seq25_V]EQC47260.1 long-chain-fatty-acid--CoA ligase [Bacteriovorax sp. Seq25_V]
MSTKPWLKSYPTGVDHEIDINQYDSLNQMLEDTIKIYGDKTAYSNMGIKMSFNDIDHESKKFASYLQNELKLQKGSKVVIQMPNLLQYPIALYGILRAGLIAVNLNPLYTLTEMKKSLVDSEASAIVVFENIADKLCEVLPETKIKHIIRTEVGDCFPFVKKTLTNAVIRYVKKMIPEFDLASAAKRNQATLHTFNEALSKGSKYVYQQAPVTRNDVALLQYTGGTTGIMKAAVLTHQNMLANQAQMSTWMNPSLEKGNEISIAALPCYHVFCLTVNCFGFFQRGMHNVLITNPRDIKGFLKTINESKPTVMTVVSTLLAGMLANEDFETVDWSTLKFSVAGGMALKRSVANEWTERTKTKVIEGYGLTEASPVVSCNPVDGGDKLGTIGLPLPSTEVKVVDENGNDLGLNTRGELCVKGFQVMQGYYKNPLETEKVLTQDGWLKTGDIAVIDDEGFVSIVDRLKDMIVVSGFNVYPNELEDVAMMHPKVAEAGAIGIADEHSGEAIKIFVVKKDQSLTEEEIRAFLREKLTGYKKPKYVEFRNELPKNNVGKILRRELK